MGCTTAKMLRVEPQNVKQSSQSISDANNNITINNTQSPNDRIPSKRKSSAKSNISGNSRDSAFIEGDAESIISTTRSNRTHSGSLKRTLRGLSARSKSSIEPLKDQSSVLEQLRSEGLLLASDTHQAKSGLSFQLFDETNPLRNKPPPRLKSLEKRQKRRQLLTQKDIEAKLEKAEQRRKEVEADRVSRIQLVTTQSKVHQALDSFVEHQQHTKTQVQEKVHSATENRAKKFREMREKLRMKEEHATLVRQRKKSLEPIKIADNGAKLTEKHTEQ